LRLIALEVFKLPSFGLVRFGLATE